MWAGILAIIEVRQDALDHRWLFDAHNHIHLSATGFASLNVDFEHALQALRPCHRRVAIDRGLVPTEERVRAALESLVRANDDSARQPATWFEMQCELIPITPNPRIEGEAFRSTAATRTSCQSREIS